MSLYYYEKYKSVISTPAEWHDLGTWSEGGFTTNTSITGGTGFDFNKNEDSNPFTLTGSITVDLDSPPGTTCYIKSGYSIKRYIRDKNAEPTYHFTEYTRSIVHYPAYYKKGEFIETILAEEDVYPNDGFKDGYWYIKKKFNFPYFKIKIDNQIKTSFNVWVKINGQLRQIDKIWTKINGELKEV